MAQRIALMTPTDKRRFAQVIAAFAEIKGRALSAPAIELYWAAMQDWTIEAFEQAAHHLLRTCEFFPTPADFQKVRRAGQLQAPEAWALVLDAIRRGAHRYGQLDDIPADVKRAVTACGGWHTIGNADEFRISQIERAFLQHFASLDNVAEARAGAPAVAHTPVGALTEPPANLDNLRRLADLANGIAKGAA